MQSDPDLDIARPADVDGRKDLGKSAEAGG